MLLKIYFLLALAQTPTTSKHTFEFTYRFFPSNLQRNSSYAKHWWKWMIFSIRSLNGFGEKNCRNSHWTWVCLPNQYHCYFFSKVHRCFFSLTRSLIDGCQIVTDTCKKNVWKFFESLINHLHCYANKKISRWSLSLSLMLFLSLS